jgi:hypothetical protein
MLNVIRGLVSVLLVVLLVTPVWAGTQDEAVIALHAKPHADKLINTCASGAAPEDPNTQGIPCSDYVTQYPVLAGADVYLVVARADPAFGIAGLSCGVAYGPALGMLGWTLCADLDFPNGGWPLNGGGNRITWDTDTNCQTQAMVTDGVHAVAGAFYVYAYGADVLQITENLNLQTGPELQVADCSSAVTEVSHLSGAVGFDFMTGFNPCNTPIPVEMTSWGAIKQGFGN